MPVSLRIYPVWSASWPMMQSVGPNDALEFHPDNRVFGQLRDLTAWRESGEDIPEPCISTHVLPEGITLARYTDDGIEDTRVDAVGDIRFVRSEDLKKLAVGPSAHPRNYALKTYLNALPDKMMVVLYWF